MDENTLKDKINQHLKIYRKNVEEILAEINLSIEDLDLLLKFIAVGGMEVVDLPDYLIAYKPDLTIEQANNLQSKLYNKVFIDIDDELKEQRANFLRGISRAEKEIQATEEYGDDFVDPRVRALLQQFEEFLKKNQALGISQAGVSEDLAKSNFYNAINNQDKQKFLASLVQFFFSGKNS
jgi:hypothetical protein